MPEDTLASVNIPFGGFYGGLWSQELDQQEEGLLDHIGEEPDRYDPALVLAQERGELGEMLWQATTYTIAQARIAQAYVEAFAHWLAGTLGVEVVMEFEEVTSPRYYNFETDRIFAKLPLTVFATILDRLQNNHPGVFERTVEGMFTSYDGFCSFYSNDPAELLDKPLDEWDHNELKVLLNAWIKAQDVEWIDSHLYLEYEMSEDVYSAFDAALDWDQLTGLAQAWAADLEDLDEAEHAHLTAYRCPDTPELPL